MYKVSRMWLFVGLVSSITGSAQGFGGFGKAARKMRAAHMKHHGMDVFKEIADLGNDYWNLLKQDPYVKATVNNLADEKKALQESVAHIKAGTSMLEPKYEQLKQKVAEVNADPKMKRFGGQMGNNRMLRLLTPAMTACEYRLASAQHKLAVYSTLPGGSGVSAPAAVATVSTPAVVADLKPAAPVEKPAAPVVPVAAVKTSPAKGVAAIAAEAAKKVSEATTANAKGVSDVAAGNASAIQQVAKAVTAA